MRGGRQAAMLRTAKAEPRTMTLEQVRDILDCQVIAGEGKLGTTVRAGCGSDLMSDVLAFIKSETLLLTGLCNAQAVRTADLTDIVAIVFVRGKRPDGACIRLAREKGIPLLCTSLLMFEACGRLYAMGLPGVSETTERP